LLALKGVGAHVHPGHVGGSNLTVVNGLAILLARTRIRELGAIVEAPGQERGRIQRIRIGVIIVIASKVGKNGEFRKPLNAMAFKERIRIHLFLDEK
jgi:hypothetical protein